MLQKENRLLSGLKESGAPLTDYGHIERLQVVRDISGLSMFHINLTSQNIGRRIMLLTADNYPEILFKAYVVNAPWVFNQLFNMVKMVLPARTISKVHFPGSGFAAVLEEEIGTSRLPDYLGGAVTEYNKCFQLNCSPDGPLALVDPTVILAGDSNLEIEAPIEWGKKASAEDTA
jgi:hypothetical protein